MKKQTLGYLKKIKRFFWRLLAAMTLMVVSHTAHAALSAFSPTPALAPNGAGALVPLPGLPAWFQDITGVSVKPCLDIANCGLAAAAVPGIFDPAVPLAFPNNFPPEAFYFRAVTNNMTVGGADVFLINALEFTAVAGGAAGVAPSTPGAVFVPFQRLRLSVAPAAGTAVALGVWTINTPWGTVTFDSNVACRNPAVGVRCLMTRDLPLAAAGAALPPGGAATAALGAGSAASISTFLKSAPPPPVPGFLGLGAAAIAFTGAAPGNANSFTITDPAGNTATTTGLKLLVGQLIGLPATPAAVAFPAQRADVVASPTTVTITNPDAVNPATLGPAALTGANAADFTVVADTCSGATLPPAGKCTFGLTFTEAAAAAVTGAKSASISFPVTAPANMPPTLVNITGSIDNTPPTVATTLPADGAIQIPINQSIAINFSEAMDPATIDANTISVAGVDGTVTYDAAHNIATFVPSADMPINTTLTATVTSGVTDLAGNPMTADKTITFTTGATEDKTPIAIVSTEPSDNSTDAALDGSVSVTFNKGIDASTLTTGSFSLSPETSGTVTFDLASLTATFKPDNPLLPNAPYTATLTTDVMDLSGNHLSEASHWKFLTEAGLGPIELLSPDDGSTGVDSGKVKLSWHAPTSKNPDAITYHVSVCENEFFVGCSPTALTATGTTALAGHRGGARTAGGAAAILSGLLMAGGIRQRRKLIVFLALAATCGTILISCGGGSGSSGGTDTTVTFTPAGLKTGTTYHWKVDADDGNGSQVESETRNFTTAP